MITEEAKTFINVDNLDDIDNKVLWPYVYVYKNLFYVKYISFIYGLEWSKKKKNFIVTKQKMEIMVDRIFNNDFDPWKIVFKHCKANAINSKIELIDNSLGVENVEDFFKKPIGRIINKKDFDSLEYKNLIDSFVRFMLVDRLYKYFYKKYKNKFYQDYYSCGFEPVYVYYLSLLKILKKNNFTKIDLDDDNFDKTHQALKKNIDFMMDKLVKIHIYGEYEDYSDCYCDSLFDKKKKKRRAKLMQPYINKEKKVIHLKDINKIDPMLLYPYYNFYEDDNYTYLITFFYSLNYDKDNKTFSTDLKKGVIRFANTGLNFKYQQPAYFINNMILEKTADNYPMSFIDEPKLKPVYPSNYFMDFGVLEVKKDNKDNKDTELEITKKMRLVVDSLVEFDISYCSYILNYFVNPPAPFLNNPVFNKLHLNYWKSFLTNWELSFVKNGLLNLLDLVKNEFSVGFIRIIKCYTFIIDKVNQRIKDFEKALEKGKVKKEGK